MKKSYAQLKRDLQVGKSLKLNYSIYEKYVGTIRKINFKQTNAITLKTIRDNGEVFDSWLDLPKSSNLVEYVDKTFKFYQEANKYNGYKKTLEFEYEFVD